MEVSTELMGLLLSGDGTGVGWVTPLSVSTCVRWRKFLHCTFTSTNKKRRSYQPFTPKTNPPGHGFILNPRKQWYPFFSSYPRPHIYSSLRTRGKTKRDTNEVGILRRGGHYRFYWWLSSKYQKVKSLRSFFFFSSHPEILSKSISDPKEIDQITPSVGVVIWSVKLVLLRRGTVCPHSVYPWGPSIHPILMEVDLVYRTFIFSPGVLSLLLHDTGGLTNDLFGIFSTGDLNRQGVPVTYQVPPTYVKSLGSFIYTFHYNCYFKRNVKSTTLLRKSREWSVSKSWSQLETIQLVWETINKWIHRQRVKRLLCKKVHSRGGLDIRYTQDIRSSVFHP